MSVVGEVIVHAPTSVDGGRCDEEMLRTVSNVSQEKIYEKNSSIPSFATVLKGKNTNSLVFPERDQAIIFDVIENTQKIDYIIGVGELVGPRNVIFASRVSNNRICIYLVSKNVVESFMSSYKGITLNNTFVEARRLVSPARRVIISNVSPCLPHEVVENELKQLGLKVVSSIRCIGAGINREGYRHILSFRRQVYIVLDEGEKLPDSTVISYKGNAFRIFLTTDEIRCFTCKKLGHISSKCPDNENQVQETRIIDNSNTSNILETEDLEQIHVMPVNSENLTHTEPDNQPTTEITKKRQAPSSESGTVSISEDTGARSSPNPIRRMGDRDGTFIKPTFKRKKKETFTNDAAVYSEFKGVFDDKIEVITFENLCKLLEDLKGKQDAYLIAKSYTEDMHSLIDLLVKVIRTVKSNALKARIKRIIKKIKSNPDVGTELLSTSQYDSDCWASQEYSTDTTDLLDGL